MRWIRWVGALLLVVAVQASAGADVQHLPLERLAHGSEAVVLGRAVDIVEVSVEYVPDLDEPEEQPPKARLARIAVDRWIGGRRKAKSIWIWGTPTWTCDMTYARKGELCLWFLDAGDVEAWLKPASRARLRKAVGEQPIYRVAHSGRGQMPVRTRAGQTYVKTWPGELRMPRGIATIPTLDPRFDSKRLVRLEALLDRVRGMVSLSPRQRASRSALERDLVRSTAFYPWSEEWVHILEVRRPERVESLLEIIRTPDHPLRQTAALALHPALDEKLNDRLSKELRSEDARRRRGALFVLGQMEEFTDLSDPLRERVRGALRDVDPEVRWRALRVWASDHSIEALPVMPAALADPAAEVRWHATRLLRMMATPSVDVFEAGDARKIEVRLLPLTRDPLLRVRRSAWEGLHEVASKLALPSIGRAIKDADHVTRQVAVGVLGRLSTPASAKLLFQFLQADDPVLRRAAATALGRRAPAGAVPHLQRALQDTDALTRTCSAWSLGEIGAEARAALPVLKTLAESDPDERVRIAAEHAARALREE